MAGRVLSFLVGLGRCRRGAAIPEFAIVAPLLVLLLLGLIEFGRGVWHYHVVNKSVGDAGRYLSRVASTEVTCPAGGGPGSLSAGALALARNLALYGNPAAQGGPILSYWVDPATVNATVVCTDNSTGAWRGGPTIAFIEVVAQVEFADLGFLASLGFPSITFVADHEQRHIGE